MVATLASAEPSVGGAARAAAAPSDTVVVSMRVLQRHLDACAGRRPCPPELVRLCGLTRIDGYVIDTANDDLLLYGVRDLGLPELRTEDLTVALRNTLKDYAVRKGNTFCYADPSCSIDPAPRVLNRLEIIGRRITTASSRRAVMAAIAEWQQVCQAPQRVVVLGVPPDTRFANLMVEADYYMKRLVNGADSLRVAGFKSLVQMTLDQVRASARSERPADVQISPLNRFWFHPGKTLYSEDEGIVHIDVCPVVLLTEAEHVTSNGERVGTGAADPLGRLFVEQFTTHYEQIARERPLYAQLAALYRFVALTRIMAFRNDTGRLGYLENRFDVPRVAFDPTRRGLARVVTSEDRTDTADGYTVSSLWLPSCGGVGMEIEIDRTNATTDRTGRLGRLRARILRGRPGPDAVAWSPGRP